MQNNLQLMTKINRKNIILDSAIILFLWAIFIFWYSSNAISIENKIENAVQIIENSLPKSDITKYYDSECKYSFSDGIYTIDASCVLQNKLPELTLEEIINEVWNQISDFSEYYHPFDSSFDYHGAIPLFESEWSPYLQDSDESKNLLIKAIKRREKIRFSYNELAKYYANKLSYFVSDKDLTNLWNCTRQNYLLALESMDNYILKPGQSFNVNQKLRWIKWYCKWRSDTNYSFYGGVCGMVSQLFRISLINPDILIKKRFSHNEWFIQYYGDIVWWDDAAVYERSKQFEIENIWNSDIIFKIRHNDNHSVMVAISEPSEKWVNISRKFINWRETAIHLEKTIYQKVQKNLDSNEILDWITFYESLIKDDSNKENNIVRNEIFDSYYTKKTHEIR